MGEAVTIPDAETFRRLVWEHRDSWILWDRDSGTGLIIKNEDQPPPPIGGGL